MEQIVQNQWENIFRKMGKYITKSVQVNKIDKETGEVMQATSQMSVEKIDSEPFFFTYSKEIMALYGKSIFNATTKVLWKLLEFAEFDTGKVYMNADRTNEIIQACKIGKTSYYRAISDLKEAGIIKGDKSTFTIAENMFWKGSAKARNELRKARLKVTFEPIYDEDDKTITIIDRK